MAEQLPEDITSLSYEKARDELIGIVSELESGQAPLEESMKLWERGEQLAQHCKNNLDGVKKKL
ncbi:MAG: exodeoxyribonuclease VII small subunit, partial [Micrococcaceae bacterium]